MTRAIEGPSARAVVCACGDADCMQFAFDYPWCRPCEDHHRLPECPVDEQGRSLAACGHPWEDTEDPAHWDLHYG
jgi:hypothetical protein